MNWGTHHILGAPFSNTIVMTIHQKESVEYASAVVCIFSSISIGISSIIISTNHDIAAGVLILIAQLLVFAASVFHLNYKILNYGETKNNVQTE